MRKPSTLVIATVLISYSTVVFAQATTPQPKEAINSTKASQEDHEHGHGPHDGDLLEVGKEEFHVEICLDEEKNKVTVYLFDKAVKSYVPIDQQFILINLKLDGKPAQFKLKATAQKSDPEGKASCYQLANPELISGIHAENSEPRLALKIANKQYNVKIRHEHNHAGHDHTEHSQGTAEKK